MRIAAATTYGVARLTLINMAEQYEQMAAKQEAGHDGANGAPADGVADGVAADGAAGASQRPGWDKTASKH